MEVVVVDPSEGGVWVWVVVEDSPGGGMEVVVDNLSGGGGVWVVVDDLFGGGTFVVVDDLSLGGGVWVVVGGLSGGGVLCVVVEDILDEMCGTVGVVENTSFSSKHMHLHLHLPPDTISRKSLELSIFLTGDARLFFCLTWSSK